MPRRLSKPGHLLDASVCGECQATLPHRTKLSASLLIFGELDEAIIDVGDDQSAGSKAELIRSYVHDALDQENLGEILTAAFKAAFDRTDRTKLSKGYRERVESLEKAIRHVDCAECANNSTTFCKKDNASDWARLVADEGRCLTLLWELVEFGLDICAEAYFDALPKDTPPGSAQIRLRILPLTDGSPLNITGSVEDDEDSPNARIVTLKLRERIDRTDFFSIPAIIVHEICVHAYQHLGLSIEEGDCGEGTIFNEGLIDAVGQDLLLQALQEEMQWPGRSVLRVPAVIRRAPREFHSSCSDRSKTRRTPAHARPGCDRTVRILIKQSHELHAALDISLKQMGNQGGWLRDTLLRINTHRYNRKARDSLIDIVKALRTEMEASKQYLSPDRAAFSPRTVKIMAALRDIAENGTISAIEKAHAVAHGENALLDLR